MNKAREEKIAHNMALQFKGLEETNQRLEKIHDILTQPANPLIASTSQPSIPYTVAIAASPISPHSPLPLSNPVPLVRSQLPRRSPESSITPPPPCMPNSPTELVAVLKRSITLAGGRVLEFAEHEVPGPPPVSFANDLSCLNSSWDDTSAYWGGKSALIINNINIPIKYWHDVYILWTSKSNNGGPWGMETKTVEWHQDILAPMEEPLENFWKEFSQQNGNRMTYLSIIAELVAHQNNKCKALVDAAKAEYKLQFQSTLSY
ncbi:hypothetical protein CVT24_012727 [Panaeolus cyanescens]|uniref:Uncharacterized protein n=1 Tax=Panaeolus cyanescens TaxID=181874 RepID=A0A409X0L4_9AGAR|nr:hypothetical protein CVT24_012727 [Panaeolus cyanescens]